MLVRNLDVGLNNTELLTMDLTIHARHNQEQGAVKLMTLKAARNQQSRSSYNAPSDWPVTKWGQPSVVSCGIVLINRKDARDRGEYVRAPES